MYVFTQFIHVHVCLYMPMHRAFLETSALLRPVMSFWAARCSSWDWVCVMVKNGPPNPSPMWGK